LNYPPAAGKMLAMAGKAEDNHGSVDNKTPSQQELSSGEAGGGVGSARGEQARRFAAQLTEEERMLVVLRRELYESLERNEPDADDPEARTRRRRKGWEAMLADLQNRLEGRPYIFKLAHRIRDDMARIAKLQAFEDEHDVDLADYVAPPDSPGSQ